MISSIHHYASMVAAFTGSLVEAVEAFTIVLAVGTVRGWRSALFGALLGFGTLLATVAIFGPAIARVNIQVLQIVIGTLLLLFGVRWFGEGIGVVWPYADAAIVGLFAGLLVFSRAAVGLARQAVTARCRQVGYK